MPRRVVHAKVRTPEPSDRKQLEKKEIRRGTVKENKMGWKQAVIQATEKCQAEKRKREIQSRVDILRLGSRMDALDREFYQRGTSQAENSKGPEAHTRQPE